MSIRKLAGLAAGFAMLLIIDELEAPDPTELVGHILVDERELAAFLDLS